MQSRRSWPVDKKVTMYMGEVYSSPDTFQSLTYKAPQLFYTDEACNGAKTSGKWRTKVIDGKGVRYKYR